MEQVELFALLIVNHTKQATQIVYIYTVEQINNNEFLINYIQVCILFVLFFLTCFSTDTAIW